MLQQSHNGVQGCTTNGDKETSSNGITSNGSNQSSPELPQRKISDRDVDVIRVIGQYLRDLGLQSSVEQLMKESGLRLDHPAASRFRAHILEGAWVEAEKDLSELQSLLTHSDDIKKMRFLLLEQKYLELLERGAAIDALEVLRHQLTPLKFNVQRVHQLSSYIMCNAAEDLREQSGWPGASAESRGLLLSRLQDFLPASVMVPPARLHALLEQALQLQRTRCQYHNTTSSAPVGAAAASSSAAAAVGPTRHYRHSLLVDHVCSKDEFPTETAQILREHNDEVWFCKFSPDGNSLATGAKDGTIVVWDIDVRNYCVKLRHTLLGPMDGPHGYAVCFLCWSPDSRYLLAAHESPDVFIWDAVRGSLEKSVIHNSSDTILCAAWHPNGDKFVCGGTHGQFYLYDLRGTLHDRWEGVRVRALTFTADGSAILAADTHNRVCAFRQDDHKPQEILTEIGDVMSMCINEAGTLLALNVANQGVHLWDLKDKVLVRRFQGLTQGTFTVHSCFGGVNQDFVASGSEEFNVYMWHVAREKPVAVLSGHTNTISCVSWNPRCPSMLASCSDDSTVRIWAPAAQYRSHHYPLSPTGAGDSSDLPPSNNGTTMS